MRRPTETALRTRARTLLEAMTNRMRWIYAVPRDDGPEAVRSIALAEGLRVTQEDTAAGTVTYANEKGTASIRAVDSEDLDVLLIEATGEDVPPVLGKILEQAGFYAQSTLLGTALDVHDEEAATALGTLAHMAVNWDEPWRDLFALHLLATDPAVRREAGASLVTAAAIARNAAPATMLLEEAIGREKVPEVTEALTAALERVRGAG
ncbi:Hypothetical protein A7982_09093 [Minicystis rosea]|nr:Hypothetical protein A7982_09093 [Minicystis rosea]